MLDGKVAIVTGASRGIGKAVAMKLARSGARIVLNATNENLLREVAGEIAQLGGEAAIVAGDVSDQRTSEAAVRVAQEKFGRIDILVNGAGISFVGSTLDMDLEEWQRSLEINLNGALYFCRAVLPAMIAQNGGKIVNISSTSAKTPHSLMTPAYGATKAALNYLTMHLAAEMAAHNVTVNAVCPGPVETEMLAKLGTEYGESAKQRIPIGRLGTPDDIANVVLFLVTALSDFVTGESINANGGVYMN